MPVLEMIIEAIVGVGVASAWESTKRRESVIRLLKRFNLDPDNPPTDFEGIYAYALVEYGVFRPEPVLNFFRYPFVQEAFKQSFYENDPSILEREAEGIVQWNEETGKLGRIDYDPRREFAAFTLVFNHLVSYSRTPAEVRNEQKLDAVLDQLEKIQTQELTVLRTEVQQLTEHLSYFGEVAANSSSTTLPATPKITNRIRWLHLSDFHVGKDNYGQRRLFKHLLDHVQARVKAGLSPDMIFVTGDVANKGKRGEYENFYDSFFIPLHDLLPTESQEHIFVIPGNHDVDRTQTRAAQTYDVLLRIPEFLDPTEEGQFERSTILPRFQAFTDYDYTCDHQEGHWLASPDGARNKKISFKGHSVGIACLNTAWLSCSDKDRHQLSAGRHLLEESLEAIDDCNFKIVLGHHPLDWLLDTDLDPMRAILGRHAAIYLHGHVHKGRSHYEDGAGYPFVALQSGACFQAREDEIWVNRFLWCELDIETRELWIEPLQWSQADHEWTLDGVAFPERYRREDRWVISLPTPPQDTLIPAKEPVVQAGKLELPVGWTVVDVQFLSSREVGLEHEQALSFFDGREPIWREALAAQIPRREIVHQLTSDLEVSHQAGDLRVTLLTGAAGEGKSTALLQTVVDLVRSGKNWQVLWHYDTTTPLPAEVIARLPQGNGTWLIISDDAEMVALRVYDVVKELRSQNRRDIQFLLCARDTDWMAENIPSPSRWRQCVVYDEVAMRGLSLEDARKIVTAWEAYGQEGLQRLDGLDRTEAVKRLVDAAKSEASSHEGAFLGAMLQVRWGEEFSEHIEDLLQKLAKQPIPNTKFTLMNALAYIAAPHAKNILSLSKVVLSGVLGISQSELKRWVLGPLGDEAAIATTGKFVYTRHQAIAGAAVIILSEKSYGDVDIDDLFINLVQTALNAYNSGDYVPNLHDWRYLSTYFFEQGDQELGIRLAQAACEAAPDDPYLVVKLAQLYREVGQPEQSVRIFREWSGEVKNIRGFYAEWGTVEGNTENHGLAVWLTAYSLADQTARTPPNNEQAKISLAGVSLALAELFERYNRSEFSEACSAAAQLGLTLKLDGKAKRWLTINLERARSFGVEDVSSREAIARLQQGIITAWEQRESELPGIPAASELSFIGLMRLLRIV